MPRLRCNFKGKCEPHAQGIEYDSVADCERNCQGVEARDLMYEILQYEPELALEAAQSDQIEVLYRLTGVRLNCPYNTSQVLKYLIEEDYMRLVSSNVTEMFPYLERVLGKVEFVWLRMLSVTVSLPLNLRPIFQTLNSDARTAFTSPSAFHEYYNPDENGPIETAFPMYLADLFLWVVFTNQDNIREQFEIGGAMRDEYDELVGLLLANWSVFEERYGQIPQN
jgi:hypothetical protein